MSAHVAVAETEIDASPEDVWSALTDPNKIKEYMFGSEVETNWTKGGSIVWKGEYEGKKYQDRGEILEIAPPRHLKLTHFSPLSGDEDVPENYHTIVYEIEAAGEKTRVTFASTTTPARTRPTSPRQLGADALGAQGRGRAEVAATCCCFRRRFPRLRGKERRHRSRTDGPWACLLDGLSRLGG